MEWRVDFIYWFITQKIDPKPDSLKTSRVVLLKREIKDRIVFS